VAAKLPARELSNRTVLHFLPALMVAWVVASISVDVLGHFLDSRYRESFYIGHWGDILASASLVAMFGFLPAAMMLFALLMIGFKHPLAFAIAGASVPLLVIGVLGPSGTPEFWWLALPGLLGGMAAWAYLKVAHALPE
jgi:hypothetical protein